ncbi:hypothetical protein [Kocuria rosea]|uniref:hypothetical protein n=1 Tax=Kocuria rosea TaxID=1275 RepID=UPI00203E261C|nr:hypothetical protein [Kocuria rosea]
MTISWPPRLKVRGHQHLLPAWAGEEAVTPGEGGDRGQLGLGELLQGGFEGGGPLVLGEGVEVGGADEADSASGGVLAQVASGVQQGEVDFVAVVQLPGEEDRVVETRPRGQCPEPGRWRRGGGGGLGQDRLGQDLLGRGGRGGGSGRRPDPAHLRWLAGYRVRDGGDQGGDDLLSD